MKVEFSREVRRLLENHSSATVDMRYDLNPYTWTMPVLGPRPPFYTNPIYEWRYPVI
ncbi:hypothetical protein [Gorillibacterium timonense]|uniref:hypothetical protein n=1 Tax=Gorillibacterium timonense TaxID=1689269 RepID=UPI0016526F94|nr:hypothetical protein [Gorillibacterium timonense]